MNLIRASLNGSDRVDYSQPTILMPVPIESDVATLFLDDVLHKTDNGFCAVGRGVPNRIANTDSPGAAANRGCIQSADDVGICPGRILSYVHDRQPLADGKRYCVLCQLEQLIECPVFREEPN